MVQTSPQVLQHALSPQFSTLLHFSLPFLVNANPTLKYAQLLSPSWICALLLGTTRLGCPSSHPSEVVGVSNFLSLAPHFNCKIIALAIKSTQPLFRRGTFNFCRISHSHTQSRRQPVWKIYINPLCSKTKLYKSWDMQNTKQVRSTHFNLQVTQLTLKTQDCHTQV